MLLWRRMLDPCRYLPRRLIVAKTSDIAGRIAGIFFFSGMNSAV
jgi:hypothetical protein